MSAYEVAFSDRVPEAIAMTVERAYESVVAMFDPSVDYDVRWQDADGHLVQRFGRTTGYEAWLVARPVNADGEPRRDKNPIICPVLIDVDTYDQGRTVTDQLRSELAAVIERTEAA